MKSPIILIAIVAATSAAPTYYQYDGPLAPIGHDGRVMDTPEVAHAKAIHLAAMAEAASKVSHTVPFHTEDRNYHGYSEPVSVGHQMYHSGHGYHGPLAPLDHEGRVIDTPEVTRAKAAHLAAYNYAASSAAPVAYTDEEDHHPRIYEAPVYSRDSYRGSVAPLSHDGRVINTPEVEHAKQAHLAAYAAALHGYNNY